MNSVVNISSVSKWFGKVRALKQVSFDVNKGELFGVIGPDGAGKTTLFRIINTLLVPDEGSAMVLGKDVVKDYKQIRPLLGYMPGRFSLYQDLTVEENLKFFASVFGTTIEENYELVKPIYSQLEKFKTRLAGDLSGGMKQKLALSCALIHKPKLLLLDEPTTGVDAVSRKEFWEMLQMLKKEGITIIVSTPYMDEADLCERVALIQEGEILQIDTPTAIVNSFERTLLGIKAANTYALLNALKSYPQAHSVQPFGEYVHYTEKTGSPNLVALKTYLFDRGLEQVEIKPIKPNIEDSFMELMQAKGEGTYV
ncbi:MAG: ABC transporter ATP-binding protein [Gracilimonas sp.]|nr:ABC transporter ATP-binding protein [Gracilimonas sp.]MBO6614611.1 ABC transporter ATP-binding protein [Gracilimonas sp.]